MLRQAGQERWAYTHYCLIYIDWTGTLRLELSPSLSNSYQSILARMVTLNFMKAVAESTEKDLSNGLVEPSIVEKISCPMYYIDQHFLSPHQRLITLHTGCQGANKDCGTPVALGCSSQPTSWPIQLYSGEVITGNTFQQRDFPSEEELDLSSKSLISLGDKHFLRFYYIKVFENLQQTNCRVIAKVYVKLVEPRKQVRYPYNGRKFAAGHKHEMSPNETKPPWWPSGVRHREPDHLLKAERIRLLVHILCELPASYGVTAQKLKAAEQPVRRHIFPAERIHLLDELYYVRELEESFLAGLVEADSAALISVKNMPDLEVMVGRDQASSRSSSMNGDMVLGNTSTLPGPPRDSNAAALFPDAWPYTDRIVP
ncbi:hypothetical protein PMG11_11392 [Penicillium brasilianum]|uniref:Subtelomeric hrmA-associated cluster protein AFUB-079030/YDR124W-like helical bundle domain-containing protein n=1 Tax=Penicillium brasilianum TaxID=104259 RepID=A0A0F7U5Z5_PENBI|nr:hypothetical protein PMG11_11392 [Penicillium brasilianum]